MFSLCWDIDELTNIKDDIQQVRVEIGELLTMISKSCVSNLPRKLVQIRDSLEKIVKGVTKFKRNVATHAFVVMISSDLRNRMLSLFNVCRVQGLKRLISGG